MTICTQDRINYFGEIEQARMQLSDIGQIAVGCWQVIPNHFHDTALDEFIVMPNHIHGIIVIKDNNSLQGDGDGTIVVPYEMPVTWNYCQKSSHNTNHRLHE